MHVGELTRVTLKRVNTRGGDIAYFRADFDSTFDTDANSVSALTDKLNNLTNVTCMLVCFTLSYNEQTNAITEMHQEMIHYCFNKIERMKNVYITSHRC